MDAPGNLHPVPLHQHRLRSSITHCLMLHPNAMVAGEPSGSESKKVKGGKGSGMDAYNWQNKSAILLAQSISDPISCFCVTGDGMSDLRLGALVECT